MNHETWVYDDPGWWIDAIYHSCSQHETICGAMTHHSDRLVGESVLDTLSGYYGQTLALLKGGTLTTERAAATLFRAKALRKWRLANPSQAAARRNEAFSGFIRRNAEASSAESIPWPISQTMKEILSYWLPEPERLGWRWTGKFGPGAVAEKWTHPQRFCHLLGWCVDRSRTHHSDEIIGPQHVHWPDVPLDEPECAKHTQARLHAVPKQFDKDRLITVEPAYGTFAQAYVREAMQAAIHAGPLRGTCMDLHYTDGQAIQRRLALKASRTGKLATLDLSDASDRIAWKHVMQVFPAWVLALLDVTRSTGFTVGASANPELQGSYKLHIFAGMGNGTTFTVETLFFAAFVRAYAVCKALPGFVSAFGDDIICHSATASALMTENFSFFRINHGKSFLGGDALRESCGIFAYKGEDITAPKVDGYSNTWSNRMALCDLHRRLYSLRWPYGQRLSYLIASEGLLVNWSRTWPGYPSLDDDRCERSAAPPTRWNPQLQRVEAHLPVRRQLTASYSTDWESAKRHNHPDPQVWYCASLAGMLGRRDFTVRKHSDRRRWSVTVPVKDSFRTNWKWVGSYDPSLNQNPQQCGRSYDRNVDLD